MSCCGSKVTKQRLSLHVPEGEGVSLCSGVTVSPSCSHTAFSWVCFLQIHQSGSQLRQMTLPSQMVSIKGSEIYEIHIPITQDSL